MSMFLSLSQINKNLFFKTFLELVDHPTPQPHIELAIQSETATGIDPYLLDAMPLFYFNPHQRVFFSLISRESEREGEGGEREKHINWLPPIRPPTRAGEPPIKV